MRHPDEGTLMAWVEAQLPPSEAEAIATHVSECDACSATVAEIRGLVARASGIVGALDAGATRAPAPLAGASRADVPRVPATPALVRDGRAGTPGRSFTARRWIPALAAAAVVMIVMRQATGDDERVVAKPAAPAAEMVARDAATQPPIAAPAPQSAAPPPPAVARGAEPSRRTASSESSVSSVSSALPKAAVPGPAGAAEPRAMAAARARGESSAPAPAPPAAPVADASAPRVAEGVPAPDSARTFTGKGVAGGIARGVAPANAAMAQRTMQASSAKMAAERVVISTPSRCYSIITASIRTIVLDTGGVARVGGQLAESRWRQVGDSIVVRWGDTLLTIPASSEGVGRIGAGVDRGVAVRVTPCPERSGGP